MNIYTEVKLRAEVLKIVELINNPSIKINGLDIKRAKGLLNLGGFRDKEGNKLEVTGYWDEKAREAVEQLVEAEAKKMKPACKEYINNLYTKMLSDEMKTDHDLDRIVCMVEGALVGAEIAKATYEQTMKIFRDLARVRMEELDPLQ